jgi:hypothetical protein
MATISQQDVGQLVEDLHNFYEPEREACGKATPAQMRLLLQRLTDYTERVKAAAAEHKLVTEWTDPWTGKVYSTNSPYNPMFAVDMANWEQRLSHYGQVLASVSDSEAMTVEGCKRIYKQVTAPLLDGIYYEALPGTNLNAAEKARMASGVGHPDVDVLTLVGGLEHPGGHSNSKPPDVISAFTLGNQVLVWRDHQDERVRQFWKDLKASAIALPKRLADAAKRALTPIGRDFLMPLGVALLGVSAVAVVGWAIVSRAKANKLKEEMERSRGSRALNPAVGKEGRESLYRVVTLGRGGSKWLSAEPVVQPGVFSLEEATRRYKTLKKRGYTVWVETSDGTFQPVKGAMRWYPFMSGTSG